MIKKENKIFRKMFLITEYAALNPLYTNNSWTGIWQTVKTQMKCHNRDIPSKSSQFAR